MNKNIDNLFINIIKTLKTRIYLFYFSYIYSFLYKYYLYFFLLSKIMKNLYSKFVAYDMYSNLNNKLSQFLFINNQLNETLNSRTSICSKGINFSSEDSIQSTLVQKILDSKYRCSSSDFSERAIKNSFVDKYQGSNK